MRAPGQGQSQDPAASVKDVLDRAADLPPDERAAFLDAACAGDGALRREVESLLKALDGADEILAAPTVTGLAAGEQFVAGVAGEGAGELVGRRYRLSKQIGEGGFGVVFLAEQERPVRRQVALKVIKLGMNTKQVVARFEAERQALALMDHPNIARVFDGGTTEGGRPYFVMELVEGPPITTYCDAKNLPVRERLELLAQVCDAVQHAHGKGVIHRDLKPTNVLVAERDGRPVPKVIDFGIAKAIQGRLTEHTLHTEQRQLVGTPEYMSPEQAELGATDVDTRSDVYGLGALLYELLVGTTPFDPKELRSRAPGEIHRMIREVEPPRPSTRIGTTGQEALAAVAARRGTEPPRLRRLVAGELDWVVMKCLEKDRSRRYETAAALADDLRRHLADEPVSARRAGAGHRLRKFARRHKIGASAAAAVAAALLLGVVGTSVGLFRARAAEQNARAGKTLAESDAAHAKAAYAFVADILEGASPYSPGGGRDAKVADLLDGAVAKLEERLGQYPEAELEARHTLARCYSALGMHEKQVAVSRGSYALSERVYGGDHALTLKWAAAIGGGLNNQKTDLDEVERLCRPSLDRARRRLGDGHAITRNLADQLARCYLLQDRFDEAESVLLQSLSVPPDVPVLGTRERTRLVTPAMAYEVTIDLLRTYALLDLARGRPAAAEARAREALEVRRRYPDIVPISYVWPDWMLARALMAQDRTEEAEEVLGRQTAFAKQNIGGGSPYQPEWLARQAEVLTARRKFPESLRARRDLLDLERSRAAHGETLADLKWDVADLLWLTGEHKESAALRRRAGEAGSTSTWRWRRAVLRPVLGHEEGWSNPGLFAHAWALADELLLGAKDAGDLVEDPAAARFTLVSWDGQQGRDAGAGTLADAPGVGDQRPGVYRLTLELPLRSGPPLRGEAWVPLWPWAVERYELDRPDAQRWAEVRSNHKAPRRELAGLALGDGWTLYAGPGGQRQNFGLVATATVELPAGTYWVAATSDDGVCVWVDNKPVIQAWAPRPATTDAAVVVLDAGRHEWRVEYFNAAGEFKLWLEVAPHVE